MLNTIWKEIKELLANNKIWTGILIVLIIFIIGTYYNTENKKTTERQLLKLGIINQDDSVYSELLISYFTRSETFSSFIEIQMDNQERIEDAFSRGVLDLYLVIPENFAKRMMQMDHTPIIVTMNITDTTKALLLQNVLKSYEKYIAAVETHAVGVYDMMRKDGMQETALTDANVKLSMELIFTALGKEAFFRLQEIDKFPSANVWEYYAISLAIMLLLYLGVYAGVHYRKEIQQGTLKRLLLTKLSYFQFMLGKTFFIFLVMFLIYMGAIFVLDYPIHIVTILLGISLCFISVALSIALSVVCNSIHQYLLVANLSLFYCLIIGGGIIPLHFLPQDFIQLSKFTPNYYMLKGILLLKQPQRVTELNQIIVGHFIIASFLWILMVLVINRRSVKCHDA